MEQDEAGMRRRAGSGRRGPMYEREFGHLLR
jgi:hypothetical protein